MFVRPVALLFAPVLAALALGVEAKPAEASDSLIAKIQKARQATWYWQRIMQRQRTPASNEDLTQRNAAYKRWVLGLWRHRAGAAYRMAQSPPHETAFRCIHRHEGPWHANTGNGYYGGLQMDLVFQRRYGSWLLRMRGPAHRWTPVQQIWVGERALRAGRGFYPWPVAARRCGLL
ncbi:MAG TPA: transglycosylase family protein [Gaiellaceae bacterium]